MEIFNLDNLFTLFMLTLLQAVLGFDNLLYISLESKRVEVSRQALLRRWGIGLAVVLRIILLFVVLKIVALFQDSLFSISVEHVVSANFNLHSIIVLFGGVFIIYTAIKEIMHLLITDDLSSGNTANSSFAKQLSWIVIMNVVFSFDSILSAMALTDVFWVMAVAIIIGGMLMIWLSDRVVQFLERNRMYEVVGLFILFIVGIMLLTEGGHLAHLQLFGYPVEAMSKATFYFVIVVVVLVDLVQTRYANNLLKLNAARLKRAR
ncbi:TerC family protein [Candidatus Spongiihabitans sp.]|uniref:TerC family protein n=1 Tax=Candidatus Spongiihabitans sp. TaxID=3101308 RepID=UPI003C6F617D